MAANSICECNDLAAYIKSFSSPSNAEVYFPRKSIVALTVVVSLTLTLRPLVSVALLLQTCNRSHHTSVCIPSLSYCPVATLAHWLEHKGQTWRNFLRWSATLCDECGRIRTCCSLFCIALHHKAGPMFRGCCVAKVAGYLTAPWQHVCSHACRDLHDEK
jgi:hypothetical protein